MRTLGKKRWVNDVLQTNDDEKGPSENSVKTHHLFEILTVFAAETSVCLPYPIPSWGVTSTCSEENNSVIGFDLTKHFSMMTKGEMTATSIP
jgi:hypothetical protein